MSVNPYGLDACGNCPHIDIFHVYDKKTGTRGKCIHTECLQAREDGEPYCDGYSHGEPDPASMPDDSDGYTQYVADLNGNNPESKG